MTKRPFYYTCLSLLISLNVYSQNFVFQESIGDFRNASSFYITSAGNFYVTDNNSDEVIKIDTLGNLLEDTGGYGWTESTFDNPSDVFATPLNVYVSDKNNHRIQRFDKNLNLIYVLDEDRIVIFDQYGNGVNIFYLPGFINNLQIVGNILTLNNKQDIYAASLKDSQLQLEKLTFIGNFNDVIISSLVFGNNLYVLVR